jgi:hypothetical protein
MLEFVSVVCFTERKKKIRATVFNMARHITSLVLFGLNESFDLNMAKPVIKNPRKNLKKDASIAGISVTVVANLTNTVAPAKHNSASIKRIIPLRI